MATVLFVVNGWLPHRYTGADFYHHNMAKILQRHGHKVEVATNYIREPYEYDGIVVHGPKHRPEHDVCIGIGGSLVAYKGLSRTCCIVHNCVKELYMKHHFGVIYVAEHLRQRFNYNVMSSFIWHPMCRLQPAKAPRSKIGKVVGMINADARKGGADLQHIAPALPDYQFIVHESWGDQVKCNLPNVEYRPFNLDIQKLYDAIDIMLIPSRSEGYCTAALEAISQGIPVVGNDIPGIREVVGNGQLLGNNYAEMIRAAAVGHSVDALQRFSDIQQNENELLNWLAI